MTLPLAMPFPPMESLAVEEIPEGPGWQYEPKWDGFRCLVFRDGAKVELQSKAGKPLSRYFPDVVESVRALKAKRFILDGEIIVPVGDTSSFDDLLQRIHPAASRIAKLAEETPAILLVFDILADERGKDLSGASLRERRAQLEAFAMRWFPKEKRAPIRLSPATEELRTARGWFEKAKGLDGVMAKLLDSPYLAGERKAMRKIKRIRTADCVVGGFRFASKGGEVGSLLLGLYDEGGKLNHVGFTSSFTRAERPKLLPLLRKYRGGEGFSGDAPGGPSRWSTERSTEWEPLAPELVVEVAYDHFSGGRFRHGTKFLRWRPDKAPAQCTYDQLTRRSGKSPLLL